MNALHRRIAAAVLAASLLVLVPATAGAATQTYSFSISGTEVSATSTTGRFVGTASGSALGTWYAEVVHDPLGGGVGAQVAIRPGGSFGMALAQAEPAYVVSGQFSGGAITVLDSGARCTNQVYRVDGRLKNVSVTGTGHAELTPGSLGAALRSLGTLEQGDAGMARLDEASRSCGHPQSGWSLRRRGLPRGPRTRVATGATALSDRPR
jgi:hypothetical protein